MLYFVKCPPVIFHHLQKFCILTLCACLCVCPRPPEASTREVMKEFGDVYEQQYAVALFNSVRYEIEGGGGAQSQLLHRKVSAPRQLGKRSSNLLSEQKQTT